ncbi:MAG: hypothetical protein ACI4BH_00050 [Muribaculaceae bacterium]
MKLFKTSFAIAVITACAALNVSAQPKSQQIFSALLERGYSPALYANVPYHPTDFTTGEVTYRGYTYTDLQLHLDLQLGTVVISSPFGRNVYYQASELEKVKINGLQVVYLDKADHRPAKGWYEIIYATQHWTLYRVHTVSNVTDIIDKERKKTQFSVSHKLYLAKGDRWTGIKNVNDLAKAFPRQKDEIKAFAKSHNLNPDIDTTEQWIKIAEHIK